MLPVGAMASIVAPVEDAAATVRHTTQLAQRPATNPAALAAAIPRVLLREGQRPEWDTYLHAVYGEHPLALTLTNRPDGELSLPLPLPPTLTGPTVSYPEESLPVWP